MIEDESLKTWYYKWTPSSTYFSPAGVYGSVLMGEVQVGQIYPVTDTHTRLVLSGQLEWCEVTEAEYDAQELADQKEQVL